MRTPLPSDMLNIRERVRRALEANGFRFTGGSVALCEPEADLDVELGDERFHVRIVFRGLVKAKKVA